MKIAVLAVSVLMFAGSAMAQAPLPACTAVPGWSQQGQARAYDADNLFEYMDGNAEGYLLYHFVGMKGITCKSGETTFNIDVSEFEDTEFAYGMFTSTRDPRKPTEKLGVNGQVTERKGLFVKDKYYVEIAANPEKDHTAAIKTFLSLIEKNIQGRTTLPDAFGWFPAEGLVAESIRLVPESVLGLRLLKSGYVGQYQAGKGFLVREASPDAAAQVFAKLQERFGTTSPAKIGDEAFLANDKYLNGMCVFRKGTFIGGFANLPQGRDGVAETEKLAGAVK
jgi:hypothetical protein